MQQLEAELFRRRFDDGALDLLAGIVIAGIGISWLSDQAVFGAILPAVVWPSWMTIHRQLVVPRLGDVEFSQARKKKLTRTHLLLVLLGCVSLAGGVAAFMLVEGGPSVTADVLVPVVLLIPSLIMAFAALVGFFLIGGRRMLVYAAVFVVAGLIAQLLLDLGPGVSLAAGGLLPLLVGAVMLARFLRTHSPQGE